MDKPYGIVLSMRRGTANWINQSFVDHQDAPGAYGQEAVTALARGMILSPSRARLKLPYDAHLLRWVRCMFWDGVSLAPYNVAIALERLVKEIDAFLQTSIVDHMVKHLGKAV